MTDRLRVAIIHDLLVSYGGSEQVLLDLHQMFPDAPIYTTIFDPSRLPPRFAKLPIRTSFLQNIPSLSRNYAAIVPLMPLAFSRFQLRNYDLVLSSAHAFSKSVTVPPGTLHVCYCYTPLRYAWSHQKEYVDGLPMKPLLAPAARLVLAQLRKWDYAASKRVDRFIAISKNVQQRIARYYGRESDVVYPAIDLPRFHPTQNGNHTDGAFLVVGRLFSYKRVHVAVDACTRLRLPLKVIGRGPELKRLRDLAGPTVQFLGEVDDTTLEAEYRNCRALLFTSDEDFGLVPLEAMASGRPVLALNAGGARETVVPGQTGVLYEDAGTEPLVQELQRFRPADFDSRSCRARAEEFSVDRFHAGIRTVLERELGRAL